MINFLTKQTALMVALTVVLLFPGCLSPEAESQGNNTERRVPVTVAPVQERDFEERISVQGNLLPKSYAMVAPLVDGLVTDMFIEEGDRVEAHKTALFQVDKTTLAQAYEIALQDKKVAESARRDANAQVTAAKAQYDKAKLDYERFLRLREQQAITQDAMEQMAAGFTVAQAQLERAEMAVALREEQEKQAESALAIARKRLDDSLVKSPIDGWVSFRNIELGEFAGAGIPVVRIADTSILEVAAFFSGEFYPRIRTGETHVWVTVSDIDLGRLPITYKSPEIQDQLRTFEIKALVESPPDGVVPGAIAQVETVLHSRSGFGIPHDVIQIRDGKEVVFVVEDGKAKSVDVETGLTTDGWTELLQDTLPPDAQVIIRGYNLVNEGTPVDVREEEH